MILYFLLPLLAISAVLNLLNRPRWAVGTGVAATLLLALAAGPLASWTAVSLQAPYARRDVPEWLDTNIIAVLGAGNVVPPGRAGESNAIGLARLTSAVRAYRDCASGHRQCQILASGGSPSGHAPSEAEAYRTALVALGVPPQDILVETQSLNTWENAQNCAEIIGRLPQDTRLVLVTSAMHMTRARLYFRRFGMRTTPWRADYLAPAGLLPSAYNLYLASLSLHEYFWIFRYHFGNILD